MYLITSLPRTSWRWVRYAIRMWWVIKTMCLLITDCFGGGLTWWGRGGWIGSWILFWGRIWSFRISLNVGIRLWLNLLIWNWLSIWDRNRSFIRKKSILILPPWKMIKKLSKRRLWKMWLTFIPSNFRRISLSFWSSMPKTIVKIGSIPICWPFIFRILGSSWSRGTDTCCLDMWVPLKRIPRLNGEILVSNRNYMFIGSSIREQNPRVAAGVCDLA